VPLQRERAFYVETGRGDPCGRPFLRIRINDFDVHVFKRPPVGAGLPATMGGQWGGLIKYGALRGRAPHEGVAEKKNGLARFSLERGGDFPP
jgi:hypothetical protein